MLIWVFETPGDVPLVVPPDVVGLDAAVVVVEFDADPPDEHPAAMTATPSIRTPVRVHAVRPLPISRFPLIEWTHRIVADAVSRKLPKQLPCRDQSGVTIGQAVPRSKE
jgi:hypothetical protein